MSPPTPEPIVDEKYGIGWQYAAQGMEVTLFMRPLPTLLDGEVVDAEPVAEEALTEPPPSSNTEPPTEKGNRVEIPGRVGRDPRLNETAKGTLIAKFPLAEHPEGNEGETVWHTIVAFKDLARKVSETVHKGDEVKVIGYRQEREHNGKTQTEINAVAIRHPKPPTPPES